ncbi:MAG: DUF4157 domain-containing protein [Dehalococcoidia bacterium]
MRLDETTIERLKDFVPEQDLQRMRVVTSRPWCWLPVLLRMGAITFAPFVIFRQGRLSLETPRGLALIAHETVHIGQVRELGWRFYPRYLWGNIQCRFQHDKHPMEIPGIEVQKAARRVLEERSGGGAW